MGFLDKVKKLVGEHDEKIDQAVEKAGDIVDQKTAGKYSDKVDKAQDFVQEKTGSGDTGGQAGRGDTAQGGHADDGAQQN